MGETLKKQANKGFTQFELSKNVLHNLKHFNLTPTGKLVLLVLVDCYNPENKAVVFPSIEFIANMAGVGLTATKQAIKDLINEGLIIKSKRSKIQGNYNKYLLTLKVQNSTAEQSENEFLKQSESDRFMNKNKKEEKINNKDEDFLNRYAELRGVKNKVAYINAIKRNGGASDIVRDLKQAEINKRYMDNATKTVIKEMEISKNLADAPTQSFIDLKLKLQKICRG